MRWETSYLPIEERFGIWADMATGSHVPMIIESDVRDDFSGSIEITDLGTVQLSRLAYRSMRGERTQTLIRRSDPEMIYVGLVTKGLLVSALGHGEFETGPGGVVVYGTSRPGVVYNPEPIEHLVLQLPRSAVGVREDHLERLLNTQFGTGYGIGGALAYLVRDLDQNAARHSAPVMHQLISTVTDLVASAARIAAGAAGPMAPETRIRAREAQIHGYIYGRLADPMLTRAEIARVHGLSTRQLNRIFESQGSSPSDWIRVQRLERCRQELIAPECADRTVVSIGARWGFPDPASFSRAFRREFGMPPGEYRRQFSAPEA